jgi:hypothetical protein
MKRARKRRRRAFNAKKTVRCGVATGSTVTLATLGLTSCNGGGGAVDPPPPPPLVCSDVNNGQHLSGHGFVQDSTLMVDLEASRPVDVDTLYTSGVSGATLDSLHAASYTIQLDFTLDSDTTSQVTFTLAGTLLLRDGPCDFSRSFTVTIDNGAVEVAQRRRTLPLGVARDIRIELVERDGLELRLRALGTENATPVWSVTGGVLERYSPSGIVWRLPAEPGFYQVELFVDRGERGFGFDALSFEVS